MGSQKNRLRVVHAILFMLFLLWAAAAVTLWLTSGGIEAAGIAATIAAFWATASAFVERIFPMGE